MTDVGSDSSDVTEVSLVMSPAEAKAVDRWSAEHQVEDRSEAVHRLIQYGLDAESAADDAHLR
jgi:metal-responsive CopG/Arc/MetJ family transcriptional regulator